jgi:hypothetical protein|tara:strand:+ start:3368 stop:3541 length:174 start_codon:yes stop_codon:yes gene_type:complete
MTTVEVRLGVLFEVVAGLKPSEVDELFKTLGLDSRDLGEYLTDDELSRLAENPVWNF